MVRFVFPAVLLLASCDDLPGACEEQGGGYDLKAGDEGECCDGLVPVNTTLAPDEAGDCQIEDLNPAKVCIACGDGECGDGENVCNCEADCG